MGGDKETKKKVLKGNKDDAKYFIAGLDPSELPMYHAMAASLNGELDKQVDEFPDGAEVSIAPEKPGEREQKGQIVGNVLLVNGDHRVRVQIGKNRDLIATSRRTVTKLPKKR